MTRVNSRGRRFMFGRGLPICRRDDLRAEKHRTACPKDQRGLYHRHETMSDDEYREKIDALGMTANAAAVSRYRRVNIAPVCALSADRDQGARLCGQGLDPGGAAVVNDVYWR